MQILRSTAGAILVALLALGTGGCEQVDNQAKEQLSTAGFSDSVATGLGAMKLTEAEMKEVIAARGSGMSETTIRQLVGIMHERDLRFEYISESVQTLTRDQMSPTAQIQLVEMEAIPRWTDDAEALKVEGVGDVTIVEIAKMKFKEKKEILSGAEYGMLKRRGISDPALLDFIRRGGTAQQLQRVADEIQQGKTEQEAMKAAGL